MTAEPDFSHLTDEGLLAQLATARMRRRQLRLESERVDGRIDGLIREGHRRRIDWTTIAKAGSLDG